MSSKWHRTLDATVPPKLKELPDFGYPASSDGLQQFHLDLYSTIKDHPSLARELPDPVAVAASIVFDKERLEPLSNEVMKRVIIRTLIGLDEYEEIAFQVREENLGKSFEEREEILKDRLVPLTIEALAPEGLGDIDGWLRYSSSLTGYALTGDLDLMNQFQERLAQLFSLLLDDVEGEGGSGGDSR